MPSVPVIVPNNTISPTEVTSSTGPAVSQTSQASGEMIDHLEAFMYQQVVSLAEGELLVGTAQKFFIIDEYDPSLLCTAFLVKGPIELEIEIIQGEWDHWIEVYDEDFAEDLLSHKQAELEEADCPFGRRTVRLP
jgi:hypothetical protein